MEYLWASQNTSKNKNKCFYFIPREYILNQCQTKHTIVLAKRKLTGELKSFLLP